jgi:hypothetical protein
MPRRRLRRRSTRPRPSWRRRRDRRPWLRRLRAAAGRHLHEHAQSCYDPKYGCYGANDRHFQRYPAFHGTFYRRPYNYRNLFDYPWHAELHEPTSLFSYNVPNDPAGGLYGPGYGNGYGPGYGDGYGGGDGKGKPQPPAPPALDGARRAPSAAPTAARSALQR